MKSCVSVYNSHHHDTSHHQVCVCTGFWDFSFFTKKKEKKSFEQQQQQQKQRYCW